MLFTRLTGKRLVHGGHEFRTHADAGIGYDVRKLHAAGPAAFRLAHVHADAAARFRVFDGVGKNVDIDLIQPKLVGVEVLFFHPADAEIKVDVLFPDHRLRDVHQVFHRLNDGEGLRAEIQLPALDLGDIQNVVDQREQMIASQRNLPQVLPYRRRISEILFRDRRKADDRVHRRADIVRHGGKEIGFCLVCRLRFPGRRLELFVEHEHDRQVKNEQGQEPGGHKADQQPVLGVSPQVLHRHEAEKRPPLGGVNRREGKETLLPAGVQHGDRAA